MEKDKEYSILTLILKIDDESYALALMKDLITTIQRKENWQSEPKVILKSVSITPEGSKPPSSPQIIYRQYDKNSTGAPVRREFTTTCSSNEETYPIGAVSNDELKISLMMDHGSYAEGSDMSLAILDMTKRLVAKLHPEIQLSKFFTDDMCTKIAQLIADSGDPRSIGDRIDQFIGMQLRVENAKNLDSWARDAIGSNYEKDKREESQ